MIEDRISQILEGKKKEEKTPTSKTAKKEDNLGKVEPKYDVDDGAMKKALAEKDVDEAAHKIIAALNKDKADGATLTKRITFYTNRAGIRLSVEDKRKLEKAKKLAEIKAKKKSKLEEALAPTMQQQQPQQAQNGQQAPAGGQQQQQNGQQSQQAQNGQQQQGGQQVDVNATANTVVSAVMGKTQDYTTAANIIYAALEQIKKKFNVKS